MEIFILLWEIGGGGRLGGGRLVVWGIGRLGDWEFGSLDDRLVDDMRQTPKCFTSFFCTGLVFMCSFSFFLISTCLPLL